MERKGHVQTVHVYEGLLFTRASVERKGHVPAVHVYLGIIIHTCQRRKGRVTCRFTRASVERKGHVQAAFSIFF